jgi:DNA polymerase III subunit epsilon
MSNGILFIDVETTGIPQWNIPPDDPCQPDVVQLAAVLCDEQGNQVNSLSTLIKPAGWKIHPSVAALNGITTEKCEAYGVPIERALDLVKLMAGKAGTLVAHNLEFDDFLMHTAAWRCREIWLPLSEIRRVCTMEMSRPVCRIPATERQRAAGYTDFKQPKLIEAYRHLFGEGFENAHDALMDVLACKRIYFELMKRAAAKVATEQVAEPVK